MGGLVAQTTFIIMVVFTVSATLSKPSAEFPLAVQLVAIGGGFKWDDSPSDVDLISPSDNTYINASPLPVDGSSFGSTILNNTIYVVGGYQRSIPSSNFFAYDVAANTWTKLRDFPYTIYGNAAVTVNGSIFSLGGQSLDYGGYMNYTYKYDAGMPIWWRIPTLLPAVAVYPCAVEYRSSIYYITDTGNLFRSDDGARTWTKMSPMLSGRSLTSCAVLPNALIMVAGGRAGEKPINSVELYNIDENTWGHGIPMKLARERAIAVSIPETDLVLVCGGSIKQNGGIYSNKAWS